MQTSKLGHSSPERGIPPHPAAQSKENAMNGLPSTSDNPTAPAVASRGKILMMAIIAGAVITNIYCTQPILPLIASGMNVDVATVDLVAGSALLGFAVGLALLLPLGDRFDRRKLVLGQIVGAFIFATMAALAPGIWALIAASFGLGIVSCVPQQLVPFAAVMSLPKDRGRAVGTVVSGIMVGILLGRTISGVVGSAYGWRAVYGVEAAFMIPVWIAAAMLLPRGAPSTNLSYGRLLASLWPLARDHRPIRESMMVQALLWACFNAFWVNLAALLVFLVIGVIVLDIGVQSGLVSNQTRAFAVDPKAQGRINSLYMTATFSGGALGVMISGWLMARYGWTGIVIFGIVLGLIAALVHWSGSARRADVVSR